MHLFAIESTRICPFCNKVQMRHQRAEMVFFKDTQFEPIVDDSFALGIFGGWSADARGRNA